ncbi:hypothetical protein ZHAS_00002564 [Anopheles sinensis]|uniref:Uncharacterized protein n=1 Tax=Anopheles sinensis TaxID=74873 RepID=A0A084VCI7_ANOSI|nr:hypothetical protein ZHAS_00002564 [Anopheles sinensis]
MYSTRRWRHSCVSCDFISSTYSPVVHPRARYTMRLDLHFVHLNISPDTLSASYHRLAYTTVPTKIRLPSSNGDNR